MTISEIAVTAFMVVAVMNFILALAYMIVKSDSDKGHSRMQTGLLFVILAVLFAR